MRTIRNRNKNGRPSMVEGERKKYKVSVKMTSDESYSLKGKARDAGISKSEYIRQCIYSSVVKERLSAEHMGYIRQLIGMANNLNQLARRANAVGYPEARSEYMTLAPRIDNIIKLIEYDG